MPYGLTYRVSRVSCTFIFCNFAFCYIKVRMALFESELPLLKKIIQHSIHTQLLYFYTFIFAMSFKFNPYF